MIKILLLIHLIGIVPIFAQDTPAIRTKILTYALGGLPENFTGYFKNGEAVMMFRASDGTLGVPIRYQGPQRLMLHESEEACANASNEQKAKPPLAFVDLPANAENVLILAAPTDTGDKVRLLAYDISSGSLGKGDYRVFNFSRSTVSMILGPQKFALSPGADTVVKDGSWNQKMTVFPIRIATVKDNQVKQVYSNFWEHHPGNRTLLFMFNGKNPAQAIRFMDFAVNIPSDKSTAGP